MRKLIAAAMISLDGVMQAPGGADEDTSGGFAHGGWVWPHADGSDEVMGGVFSRPYELLLGRRTYDIFAAYWPHQADGVDGGIATLFNSIPKYVASRGNPDLGWEGSTHLGPDLATAVRAVRDKHEKVHVIGSLNLVQTLLHERLFDQLEMVRAARMWLVEYLS